MKKVLLVILCIAPAIIEAMAADEGYVESTRPKVISKKNQRPYSVSFRTDPLLTEKTGSLDDLIDQNGLDAVKARLKQQQNDLAFNLGLAGILLKATKGIAPSVRTHLEKQTSTLATERMFNDMMHQQIEFKEQKRDETLDNIIKSTYSELSDLGDMLDDMSIGDEIRENLARRAEKLLRKEEKRRWFLEHIAKARKRLDLQTDDRLRLIGDDQYSTRPHFTRQSSN